MQLSRSHPVSSEGLLYPLMWICALAVIVFSVVGTISMAGWIPHSLLGDTPRATAPSNVTTGEPRVSQVLDRGSEVTKAASVFQCAACGVIDSVRDIERRNETPALTPPPAASSPGR